MAGDKATTTPTAHSLVVQGLSKNFGDICALHDISFAVKPGEIVGFLGPNGAGKTTTMKILTGLLRADAGTAHIAGLDIRTHSREVRKKIGYLPENVPLYEDMLVLDYLHFIAEIRGVPRKERKSRIALVARQTDLTSVLARTIHELSKGYRQRLGLAQAILHEPDVIILDEPTTGLDPNQLREFRDVIKTIGREKTVLFSTHILQEITAVCNRLIIIHQGRLVADGTPEQLAASLDASASLEDIFRHYTSDAGAIAEVEKETEVETEAEADQHPEVEHA